MRLSHHLIEFLKGNGTSPTPYLPWWVVKTIEATSPNIGDISTCRQTRSHKQQHSVALMTYILDICDPKAYIDA